MKRKKKIYESRSNEARKNRRIARSGQKAGKKSPLNGTSNDGSAKGLELGKTPEEILRDLLDSADPRVQIQALRLKLKQLAPKDSTSANTHWYPSLVGMNANDATAAYLNLINDPNVEFLPTNDADRAAYAEREYQRMISHVARESAEEQEKLDAAVKAKFASEGVPYPPARPKPGPQPEKHRPENVIVLQDRCSLPEHQPIADSKCAFCRQLWAKAQEAAEDARLRHQRPPRMDT